MADLNDSGIQNRAKKRNPFETPKSDKPKEYKQQQYKSIRIDPDDHKRLKDLAHQHNTSVVELIRVATQHLVTKYKK